MWAEKIHCLSPFDFHRYARHADTAVAMAAAAAARGHGDIIFVRRRHRVGQCCQHRLICHPSFRNTLPPGFIIVAAFPHIYARIYIRHTRTILHDQIDIFQFLFFLADSSPSPHDHLYSNVPPMLYPPLPPYKSAPGIWPCGRPRDQTQSPAEWRHHQK